LIKMIILEENFKWHLEAFASELFIYTHTKRFTKSIHQLVNQSHFLGFICTDVPSR